MLHTDLVQAATSTIGILMPDTVVITHTHTHCALTLVRTGKYICLYARSFVLPLFSVLDSARPAWLTGQSVLISVCGTLGSKLQLTNPQLASAA